MAPEQFCYWLQGFAELHGQPPTQEQWKSILEHLGTVFIKVTPPVIGQKEIREHFLKLQKGERKWDMPPPGDDPNAPIVIC